MERAGILINKLQQQLQKGTDVHKMLVTAQMLYTELLHEKEKLNGSYSSLVAITSPFTPPVSTDVKPVEVEKNEVVVEAIPHIEYIEPVKDEPIVSEPDGNVAQTFVYETPMNNPQPSNWAFSAAEVPTLAQQEKVVYELKDTFGDNSDSLNDRLNEDKPELGSMLKETPIRDLKKAISINERHRFIDALFRGDETMYERSIKTINNFSIFAEAEFWIQRELKLKNSWDNNNPEVKLFDQLVKRRFS